MSLIWIYLLLFGGKITIYIVHIKCVKLILTNSFHNLSRVHLSRCTLVIRLTNPPRKKTVINSNRLSNIDSILDLIMVHDLTISLWFTPRPTKWTSFFIILTLLEFLSTSLWVYSKLIDICNINWYIFSCFILL